MSVFKFLLVLHAILEHSVISDHDGSNSISFNSLGQCLSVNIGNNDIVVNKVSVLCIDETKMFFL